MSRILRLALISLGLIVAGAAGYGFGAQHAKKSYGEHFMTEAFDREYHEARHDFGMLRLLTDNKIEGALQMAQYRYYSRLLLAAETVRQSPNQNVRQMLQVSLNEAKEFQTDHPFRFPDEKDQKAWDTLISSSQ